MHGWAKGMKPEVCFVVGLVSFSDTAGVGKEERQGHGGQASRYFSAMCTWRFKLISAFLLWCFSSLIFHLK